MVSKVRWKIIDKDSENNNKKVKKKYTVTFEDNNMIDKTQYRHFENWNLSRDFNHFK